MGIHDPPDPAAALRQSQLRFHRDAYGFLLTALHRAVARLEERRHISGGELVDSFRELALERFGPMARTVLEHWGVLATEDIGEVVFALVEMGVLVKDDSDRPEDFAAVFDFGEAFDRGYPWKTYRWRMSTICPWTIGDAEE